MNAYIDSSVVLRVVLGQRDRLRSWSKITSAVASELVPLECLRTVDRARIRLGLADAVVAERRQALIEAIETFTLIPITPTVLETAARPFPTLLGSLDAIHLASALLARERSEELVLATHDAELAIAARASGFTVHGA